MVWCGGGLAVVCCNQFGFSHSCARQLGSHPRRVANHSGRHRGRSTAGTMQVQPPAALSSPSTQSQGPFPVPVHVPGPLCICICHLHFTLCMHAVTVSCCFRSIISLALVCIALDCITLHCTTPHYTTPARVPYIARHHRFLLLHEPSSEHTFFFFFHQRPNHCTMITH